MRGVITGKDVVFHSVSIVRLWGVPTYLHCLWAAVTRRPSTFLSILFPGGLAAETVGSETSPTDSHWRTSR